MASPVEGRIVKVEDDPLLKEYSTSKVDPKIEKCVRYGATSAKASSAFAVYAVGESIKASVRECLPVRTTLADTSVDASINVITNRVVAHTDEKVEGLVEPAIQSSNEIVRSCISPS